MHVAYAHFANGRPEVAANTAKALATFYQTQRAGIQAIIRDPTVKQTAMNRPHVRFDGDSCQELSQDWSHAQNDALGYFIWLYVTLALRGQASNSPYEGARVAGQSRLLRRGAICAVA